MNKIPGLKADVGFGGAEMKLPDWRKSKELGKLEADPDDEEIETSEDVKAILGFDPAEEDEESEDDMTMTKDVLTDRLAANRCKDRAGLPPGAVENTGTSEGVKKGWEKRHVHDHGFDPLGGGKWRAVPSGDIVDKDEMMRRKAAMPVRESPKNEIFGMSWDQLEKKQGGKLTRNSTMLEQASPSPMLGKYAAGKRQKFAKNVLADRLAKNSQDELEAGIKVEMEHGGGRAAAKKIALDHLREDPKYYSKLKDCGMAK